MRIECDPRQEVFPGEKCVSGDRDLAIMYTPLGRGVTGAVPFFFALEGGEIIDRIAMLGGDKSVGSDHAWAMGAVVMERRVARLCMRRQLSRASSVRENKNCILLLDVFLILFCYKRSGVEYFFTYA